MSRGLMAIVMVVACAICAPANARVFEQPGGELQVERSVPLAGSVPATKRLKAGSPDAVYSNLGTFRNQSFAAGGSAQQILNTITRMAADDLNLVGTPPYPTVRAADRGRSSMRSRTTRSCSRPAV